MDAKFTRRRFLAAASAGTAYLALTNTVGCELLGRASKVGRSRTPKVRALQTPLVSPLPNISSPFSDGLWTFARRLPDDTISIFDNGTTVFRGGLPDAIEESRAIVLELDEWRMRASLVGEYTHPDAAGNTQVLANGNVFVGWGRALAISEFSHDGELLFDAGLPPENRSYRAFRFPWNGHPTDRPACVAERTSEEEVRLYAGWNGATEVERWEVFAGPRVGRLRSLESVPRNGFETAMLVQTPDPYVAVRARRRSGRVPGTTDPVTL